METPLGPKYILYSYMEPLAYWVQETVGGSDSLTINDGLWP